ncbi:MAG: fused response regulator/thioredoxin-disulfide reductase [Chloroflexi bacterium]|nr:MAG: fused response regulator/thioredoxin-disulfide reductase [Chloroflexota bacterium]
MAKPVIFSVDDDPEVLRAIVRDLRRHYGDDYRVMRASSGEEALTALRQLQRRNEPVALFLVDQRMPTMSGVEFMTAAMQLYPDACRVLLTAYADTEAAISAINNAGVHYYLLKPWDPPEEKLYPVLDDLLADWLANYRPPFEGIRIVGHRWSPTTHELKDFLARNQVPYQYLDIELDPEARAVLARFEMSADKLPLLFLPDGEVMVAPRPAEVAERIGLKRSAGHQFYDLAIVGGGPAGLAAAVYGASEGLRTVLIEKHATGGQAGSSSKIENYLGFPAGLSGSELARRATAQARRFGVEIIAPQQVVSVRLEGTYRIVQLADGSEISCHALVVASGLDYQKLDAPGIERLTGAGVYYGASLSEVSSCRDEEVFVIGAGNSAGQAAIFLTQHASHVTLLVRGDSLEAKMSQYLVQRIYEHPAIDVKLHSVVTAAHGEDHLEAVTVCDLATKQESRHEAAALFIFIGAMPSTQWLCGVVKMDKYGFVLTGPEVMENGKPPAGWPLARDPFLLESSVPGIFVVGDVRANSVKRVASAVGEGSIAVQFVHQHLAQR